MWHSGQGGSTALTGRTVLNTAQTAFLVKGRQATISVDGSRGARITPGNGVLVQVMETDDPGSMTGVYAEPTAAPSRVESFDVTADHTTDVHAAFTDITLTGDLYNGLRGDSTVLLGGHPTSIDGLNMVVHLLRSRLEGVISASSTRHRISTITSAEYAELGVVDNTVGPMVNNGVLVELGTGSTWTVTATSHLSRLTLAADAMLRAPHGRSLTMTVDGTPQTPAPGGTYSGAIVLDVA